MCYPFGPSADMEDVERSRIYKKAMQNLGIFRQEHKVQNLGVKRQQHKVWHSVDNKQSLGFYRQQVKFGSQKTTT